EGESRRRGRGSLTRPLESGSKSRDELFTLCRDIRNRRNADSLEFRLPDDVSLHKNSMTLHCLRIEVSPKVAKVREAIFTKTKQNRLCSFNFFAGCSVGHSPAHRTRCASQHPGSRLVRHASYG